MRNPYKFALDQKMHDNDSNAGTNQISSPAMDIYEKEILSASILWWQQHRPIGWDVDRHLSNPCVNCAFADERLAGAVASLLIHRSLQSSRQKGHIYVDASLS